jgi:hypothetical protein
MDWKLRPVSSRPRRARKARRARPSPPQDSPLAQEVAEVGDRVLGVADELALGLPAVQLLALDVREDRGDLAVSVLVGNHLSLALLLQVRYYPDHPNKGHSLSMYTQWSCTSFRTRYQSQPAGRGLPVRSFWLCVVWRRRALLPGKWRFLGGRGRRVGGRNSGGASLRLRVDRGESIFWAKSFENCSSSAVRKALVAQAMLPQKFRCLRCL